MLGKRKNSRMTPPVMSFGNDAFLGEEGIGLPLQELSAQPAEGVYSPLKRAAYKFRLSEQTKFILLSGFDSPIISPFCVTVFSKVSYICIFYQGQSISATSSLIK